MQDSTGKGSSETKDKLADRKSEATSDETLGDIEETEKSTNSSNPRDPGPSPDGSLDESDELKDAGPM